MPIWNCEQCSPCGGHKRHKPYEAADGKCPGCGRTPETILPGQRKIRRLSVVHLLVRDDAGAVKLWNDEIGRALGYRIACGAERKPDEFLTGCSEGKPNLGAVTCPGCNEAANRPEA